MLQLHAARFAEYIERVHLLAKRPVWCPNPNTPLKSLWNR